MVTWDSATLAPRGVYVAVAGDDEMADALSSSAALHSGRPAPHAVRKYTVFPGKSKFLCDGRIMQGPDRFMLAVTLTLILVPAIVFAAVEYARTHAHTHTHTLPVHGGRGGLTERF
jgi:hypothetical protein